MPPTTCPSTPIGRTSCISTKFRAVTAAMWPWLTAHRATSQDWRSDGSLAKLQPSSQLGGIKLLYRHAWRNPAKRLTWIVKHDLDWNTVHDPDDIVGRILGRKQSKLQSRATLEAVDTSIESKARENVDPDHCALVGTNVAQLRFLEIRGDMECIRSDREQRLPRLHVVACSHRFVRDTAGLRCADLGVRQVEPRLRETGLLALDCGLA
jgi:hypothetical protein